MPILLNARYVGLHACLLPGCHTMDNLEGFSVIDYKSIYTFCWQDSQDPLANSILQHQFPGTLVLELDWLPLRTDKKDPLVLCIAGADSSFRLVEIIL